METIINKRIIFTVTTGRSGTAYLKYDLQKLRNTVALHEPSPHFHKVLRTIQENPGKAKEFWLKERLPFIKQQPGNVYIETSHVVNKGFLEPLLELNIVPDLILIERDPRAVARSMVELNIIPARTQLGKDYYLQPDDSNCLTTIKHWKKLSDYQLCFWYCLETFERMHYYENLIHKYGGNTVRVSFEDIISKKAVKIIQKKLQLPSFHPLGKLKFLYRKYNRNFENTKHTIKHNKLPSSFDFDKKEEEVRKNMVYKIPS